MQFKNKPAFFAGKYECQDDVFDGRKTVA